MFWSFVQTEADGGIVTTRVGEVKRQQPSFLLASTFGLSSQISVIHTASMWRNCDAMTGPKTQEAHCIKNSTVDWWNVSPTEFQPETSFKLPRQRRQDLWISTASNVAAQQDQRYRTAASPVIFIRRR